ncbi:MAG: glycosyltransferase [Parcubacteria group bacterium]|jgi:glycosyltransferase involved in cell wall biosynthesis
MQRILINIPTTQNKNISQDWLRIFRVFQSHGLDVFVNAGLFVKNLDAIKDVHNFEWLEKNEKEILQKNKARTKIGFMFHSLKRTFVTLKNRNHIFEKKSFDIIYTPSAVLDFVIFPYYLKIKGKKIGWATSLANTVPFTDPGNRIIRFLAWVFFQASIFMLRKADVIFTPTVEIKKYLLKRGFPPEKLIETSFAVENDLIEKAYRLEAMKIDALFIGRINETKGIFDMLKVLGIIVKEYPDFQLAIMGNGDIATEKKFRGRIKKFGLGRNIQFLGYRTGPEKYNIIKSAKCFWFLSVSKSESFGMALLEAVCSGIPAFTYDLSQFSYLYPNGEVIISPKGDYEAVAKKVIELFKEGNFSNEKGKLLLGKYSWEKIAEIEYASIKSL